MKIYGVCHEIRIVSGTDGRFEAIQRRYNNIDSALNHYYAAKNLELINITKMETKEILTGTFILSSIVIRCD